MPCACGPTGRAAAPAFAPLALRRGKLPSRSLQILYEDETLLVVNKPAGLLAVPLERREGAPSRTSASRITFALAASDGL